MQSYFSNSLYEPASGFDLTDVIVLFSLDASAILFWFISVTAKAIKGKHPLLHGIGKFVDGRIRVQLGVMLARNKYSMIL